MEVSAKELERRRKISESKKGKKRPDLAERNRSAASRARPRVMSDEGKARLAALRTKHGHARSRPERRQGTSTYYIWGAMVQRCTNPSNADYHLYGGRGITICDEWKDFRAFLTDMGERPEGRSIDRIDNSRGYEPGNCRWATSTQQARNTRKNKLTAADVSWIRANPDLKLAEVAQRFGVGQTTVGRVRRREGRFA